MEPLLSLPADQFRAALAELQLDPQREADLVRQYRRANSPLAPLFGLLDRVAADDAGEGVQRASMVPVARPEGMSAAEAVRSGQAQFAVPQGVLDAIGALAGGIDAPGAAARGLIPAQDMPAEALGTAGVAMGAGGLLSRPAGSVGMGGRVDAETPAQRVASLLREGRASEVTDDLMAQADPQEMYRLYVSGETGMDLPMDEASRMARAREMGFDVENLFTHGSKRDFPAFLTNAEQSTDFGWYGQGVSLAPNDPNMSNAYAMVEKEGMGRWGGRTYPVTSRGQMYEWPESNPATTSREQSIEVTNSLRNLGYEGSNIYAPNNPDVWGVDAGRFWEQVIYDPRNIRSRFARFDPRLSHLANLNAANVSPIAGLLALMQAQEPRQ